MQGITKDMATTIIQEDITIMEIIHTMITQTIMQEQEDMATTMEDMATTMEDMETTMEDMEIIIIILTILMIITDIIMIISVFDSLFWHRMFAKDDR